MFEVVVKLSSKMVMSKVENDFLALFNCSVLFPIRDFKFSSGITEDDLERVYNYYSRECFDCAAQKGLYST